MLDRNQIWSVLCLACSGSFLGCGVTDEIGEPTLSKASICDNENCQAEWIEAAQHSEITKLMAGNEWIGHATFLKTEATNGSYAVLITQGSLFGCRERDRPSKYYIHPFRIKSLLTTKTYRVTRVECYSNSEETLENGESDIALVRINSLAEEIRKSEHRSVSIYTKEHPEENTTLLFYSADPKNHYVQANGNNYTQLLQLKFSWNRYEPTSSNHWPRTSPNDGGASIMIPEDGDAALLQILGNECSNCVQAYDRAEGIRRRGTDLTHPKVRSWVDDCATKLANHAADSLDEDVCP